MLRLPLHTIGVPAAGFLLMLGAAALVAGRAAEAPTTHLYEAARSYLQAIHEGDESGAASRRVDGDRLAVARGVHTLQGGLYLLQDLRVGPDGRSGTVRVIWYDAAGRPLRVEDQAWVAGPDGRWRLDRTTSALPAWHR